MNIADLPPSTTPGVKPTLGDTDVKAESDRLSSQAVAGRVMLWLAMGVYIAYFGALTLFRHEHFATSTFDLGIFDQSVWIIGRDGDPVLSTRGLHPFADHFTPLLFLLSPLYRLWNSPNILLILQTAILALGALPVYNIAERRLQSVGLSLVVACGYLLFPALQWMNFFDFHPEACATTLLLFAIWFLECRKFTFYWIAIALSLLCKETVSLTICCLGFYVGATAGWRMGVRTTVVGAIMLLVALSTVKHFNNGQPSPYIGLYNAYGESVSEIVTNFIAHPSVICNALTSEDNRGYILDLLKPVACLAALAPEILVIALPSLLLNMLSNRANMHTVYYQYNALIIPFIFVALISGIRFCCALLLRLAPGHITFVRLGMAIILLRAISLGVENSPLAKQPRNIFAETLTDEQSHTIRQALAWIPAEASLSTQSNIAPHATHRRHIYMFPNPFQEICWGNSALALSQELGDEISPLRAQPLLSSIANSDVRFVLLCPESTHWPLTDADYSYFARMLVESPNYGVVWIRNTVVVLRRGADHKKGQQLLRNAPGGSAFAAEIGLNGL